MASPIRRAVGALVIAMLLSMAVLGAGCGGGDDGSERAVEWFVDRPVDLRSVRVVAPVEYCSADWPRLERPIIEYAGDRVDIELRHAPEEMEGEYNGCLLELVVLRTTITLGRDLDELVLFDASADPPEQRWPRQR